VCGIIKNNSHFSGKKPESDEDLDTSKYKKKYDSQIYLASKGERNRFTHKNNAF
jgi:hypothetical protein